MTVRGFDPHPSEPAYPPMARGKTTQYMPGLRGMGDQHQAARMEESNSAYWFAFDCAQADPETFEPLRAYAPGKLRKPVKDRSHIIHNTPTRQMAELPDFAVVRVGKTTAHVVHTPSGIQVTDEMPIPEAMKRQQTITEVFVKMGRVA